MASGETGADADLGRGRLAELDERPVNEHPDVLEAVHGRLAGELDRLVIPRAEPRDTQPGV